MSPLIQGLNYRSACDANDGCNSCASLAGLVLRFIACFILLVIAPLGPIPSSTPRNFLGISANPKTQLAEVRWPQMPTRGRGYSTPLRG